ncbi:hypothetical protein J437_LFUL007711 [Ladona fulva]|uniref:SET domain-containing protein n=1 Tax=Ladona fulva TaxID=123851 RepID=A0A8K0K832_LADFU|nr:hypothetical protein J437_LFUL007711 [Ladona fulva]
MQEKRIFLGCLFASSPEMEVFTSAFEVYHRLAVSHRKGSTIHRKSVKTWAPSVVEVVGGGGAGGARVHHGDAPVSTASPTPSTSSATARRVASTSSSMSSSRMGGAGSGGRMSLIVQLGAVVATALEEVGGASQHDTVVEVSTGLGAESSEPEEVYQKHKAPNKYPGSCGLPYQDHNYGAPPPPTPPLSPTANRQGESEAPGNVNNRGSSVPEATLSAAALKLERGDDEDSRASVLSSPRHGLEGEPEEGEETETAPEGEEEDDSVTSNFEHDDGYMICCDKCLVWQHVDCMGIDRSNIPDEYHCERCQPRRVDRTRARALQLRKREELNHHHSDSSLSSSSSSSRSPVPPSYSVTNGPNSAGVGDISDDTVSGRRKRRTSSSSSLAASRAKSAADNKKVTGMKRKKQEISREGSNASAVTHQQSQAASSRNSATSQRPLRRRKRRDSMKGAEYKRATAKRRGKASKSLGSDDVMGDEETQDSWEVGNTGGSGAVQLRKWIDNYEEAVTNHYSPELRARLSAIRVNGIHSGLNSGTNGLGSLNISSHHSSASKCRVTQLEPGIRALVASSYLHTNQIVIEIRGKYMLGTQHRQQSSIAKRYPPFLFFYELPKDGTEVCVDARTYGNAARFIRRSCRPNAEVRHCIEKGVLHLYIVTTTNIEKNAEITILHESHHQQLDSHGHLICACNSKDCTAPAPYKRNGFMETDRDRRRRGRRTISSEGDTEPSSIPNIPSQTTASHSITRKGPKSPTKVQPVTPPANAHPQTIQEDSSDTTRTDVDVTEFSNKKKLTREERKMEAIMKAFERLEKAEQRRQEVLARQAQRKEQDVGDGRVRREEDAVTEAVVAAAAAVASKRAAEDDEDEDEKHDHVEVRHTVSERPRRKGRKGRGRLAAASRRNSRVHSGDGESDLTSADEAPAFSPNTTIPVTEIHPVNSLPISNSASLTSVPVVACPSPSASPSPSSSSVPWGCENGSSSAITPQLPISTLPYGSHSPINNIAFAGPLTPGFKFPKTKKVLMNEWLNKGPSETIPAVGQSLNPVASPLPNKTEVNSFPHSPVVGLGTTGLLPLSTGRESLACALVAAAIGSPLTSVSPGSVTTSDTGVGSAKKRWLRQAIKDETDSPANNACCSPNSRAGSPPCAAGDYVTPLKKRRLARESMSSEQSFTPPTTPVGSCENEVGHNSTSPPPANSSKVSSHGKNCHESVVEQEDEDEEEYEEEEEEEEEEDGAGGREEVVECASADNTQVQTGDAPNEGNGVVVDANEESEKVKETLDTGASGGAETSTVVQEIVTESENKDVLKTPCSKLEESSSRSKASVCNPKGSDSIIGNLRKNGISQKELPFTEVKESQSQPATKRKLSISEYRKRKLRASGDEKTEGKGDKEAFGSPTLLRSSGSLDSSSETDQLSAKDDPRILAKAASLMDGSDYDKKGNEEKPSELNYARWDSAPTLVERQRENLTQRLKREFGLCVGDEEEQERLRKHLGIPEVLDKVLGKEAGCETKLSSRMLVAQNLAAPPPPPKSPPLHTNLSTSASGTVGHLPGSRVSFSPVNIKSVQISGTSQPGTLYAINGGGSVGMANAVGTNVAGVSSYGYQGIPCVPSVSLPPPPPPPLPPQYQLSSAHPYSVTSPNSSSPAMAGRPSRAPGLGAPSVMPPVTASSGIQIPATAAGNIIVSPSVRAASKTFFGQGFLPSRT